MCISSIKPNDYQKLFLPSILFVANVTCGLSALSLVNIPMFSAFRRLTVLFVMCAEYFMLRKTHSRQVVLSVIVLTTGAFVSALGDVTFSALGYMLVFLNNALTAMYLATIKRVMRDLQIEPLTLLYYVNLFAFPLVLCVAIFTGDLGNAISAYRERPLLHETYFFVPSLVFVAASAFCVNLSTSLCTHVTSPLTTSVAGQLKNVLQTFLGFFSWGYQPTVVNVAGLVFALCGQIAFGVFKFQEGKKSSNGAPDTRAELVSPRTSAWNSDGHTDDPSPANVIIAEEEKLLGPGSLEHHCSVNRKCDTAQ